MRYRYMCILALSFCLAGCEKSLELDLPKGTYTSEAVFYTDDLAKAAVKGMYLEMIDGFSPSPFTYGLASDGGLLSDEMIKNIYFNEELQLVENNVTPSSGEVVSLWGRFYRYIFIANTLQESLEQSKTISSSVRRDGIAEARFVRALSFFYLANLYGDVPLTLTSNYTTNASLAVSSQDQVYQQIIEDLQYTQVNLLGANTTAGSRNRPSNWSATALLAKVYLYQKNWAAAELEATKVISQSALFQLENLNNVFLANSKESIWALSNFSSAVLNQRYTSSVQGPATANSALLLSPYTVSKFDQNDQRKMTWTKTINGTTAPYKLKKYTGATGTAENLSVLRLAEQYLIRAEARAMQGNLSGAIQDVDMIRQRAGAVANDEGPNSTNTFKTIGFSHPDITQSELIKVIYDERLRELFAEQGERWFDAKRATDDLNSFFEGRKPGITATDAFFPIPLDELKRNKNLVQRPGY